MARRIYRRNGRTYWVDLHVHGKRVRRSTGTTVRKEANRIAEKLEHELLFLIDLQDPDAPPESLTNPVAKLPRPPSGGEERAAPGTFRYVLEKYAEVCRAPSKANRERPVHRSKRIGQDAANGVRAVLRRSRELNSRPVADLRKSDFLRLWETMREGGASEGYVVKMAITTRRALRWGALDGRCPALPFSVPVPPLPAHPVALDAEQVGQLLAAADPTMRMLLAFVTATGVRHSEAARLKVRDIAEGPAGMYVMVRRTKSRKDRAVQIPSGVAKDLRKHLEGRERDWPVFPSVWSADRPVQSYRERVRRVFQDAGLHHPDLRPGLHALRRTSASAQLAAGASLATIMAALGWSELKTAQRYLASSDRQMRESAEAGAAALGLGGESEGEGGGDG